MTFLLFSLGFWGATIYKRWSVNGLLVAGLGMAVPMLGIAGAVTLSHHWGTFGHWAVQQTPSGVAVGTAGVILVLAAASFLTLRRATP